LIANANAKHKKAHIRWEILNKLLHNFHHDEELNYDMYQQLYQDNPAISELVVDASEPGLKLKTDIDSTEIPTDTEHNLDLSKNKVQSSAKTAAKNQLKK
jgi:hypothetical protein